MENITQDPLAFGVGARVTLSVMSDRYVEVLLAAVDAADSSGLVLETGDVSTYAGGDEQALLRWLTDLTQHVAATGLHASVQVLLSRGCPGEAVCELPGGAGPRRVDAPRGRRTGTSPAPSGRSTPRGHGRWRTRARPHAGDLRRYRHGQGKRHVRRV